MADGMGGMIANLMMGNPAAQLNQPLAGPQPGQGGPAAAAGGGQQGAMNSAPSPDMAKPQATQSPPDLARLYLQLEQSKQMGEGINRGLAMMLGGFKGPPGGAQQIMQGMTGGQSQDPGALLQNLLQMRQQQATMNMPAPPNVNPQVWAAMDPATKAKVYGDIITQQAGIGGPPVMQEMNRGKLIYMKQHGITDPNDPSIPDKYIYPDKYVAAGTAEGKTAGDIAEAKTSAIDDFGTIDPKLEKGLTTVNQLLGDMNHTMEAITTFKPTSGLVAANLSEPFTASDKAKEQAAALKTLTGELSSEAMGGIKNIRNKAEFGAVVSSQTGAFEPGNSEAKVQQALEMMKSRLLRARAIATAAAGHKLTGDLVGQLGPDSQRFLDPNSPYYQGATEEKAPTQETQSGGGGLKPLPDTTDQAIQQKLKDNPMEKPAIIKHFEDLGFDMSKYK